MEYLYIFLGLFVILATLSAQAGFSMKFFNNRLQNWQNKIPLGNRIPEALIGVVFGTIAIWGWDFAFNLVQRFTAVYPITTVGTLFVAGGLFSLLWLFAAFVSFVGKESATVFYLPGNWDGYDEDTNKDGIIDFEDGRKSTMRPFNDFIARRLGVGLGSKWYPKIWAFTKGLLISIPICILCAPFMPITRHIGILLGRYMNKKFKHSVNFYAEFFGDGLAYSSGLTLFIFLCRDIFPRYFPQELYFII